MEEAVVEEDREEEAVEEEDLEDKNMLMYSMLQKTEKILF